MLHYIPHDYSSAEMGDYIRVTLDDGIIAEGYLEGMSFTPDNPSGSNDPDPIIFLRADSIKAGSFNTGSSFRISDAVSVELLRPGILKTCPVELTPDPAAIKSRMKELTESGLTVQELCHMTARTEQEIAAVLDGKRASTAIIVQVADALDVPVDCIVTDRPDYNRKQ